MLSAADILDVSKKSYRQKVQANASVALVGVSQLQVSETSVGCRVGERPAAGQASATCTTTAETPPQSRLATT